MSESLEKMSAAISKALEDCPVSDVLTVLTGCFVGLTVEMVRRNGHDINKEIKVDGGGKRDITIHALKGTLFCADCGCPETSWCSCPDSPMNTKPATREHSATIAAAKGDVK